MRVVHISKVKGIAGSEGHLLCLLPALAARGLDVRMIVLEDPCHPTGVFRDALVDCGIPVELVQTRSRLDPLLRWRLARSLRASAPDLVHTHLVHADLYGLAAARRAGVAAAVSSRHDNNPFRRGRVVGWLNRRAMRHARRVIAISRAVAQFVIDVEGIDSRKVVTVHYGLEPGSISPAQRALARAALGCSESGFVIGFVGRLIEQKGVDVLIDAFPAIRERHPQATLVIVGDGPLRERLRARAEKLGLGASARFAGWVPQARSIMPACDLVAMPSRWEGFGLTALEAMACGLPLVASDVDALPEILRDQETGLLVPPDDSRALAAAINGLLDRPEWAAQLGGHGRERVLRFFSVERMAGATIDVYIAALADARGSRDAVPVGT